MKKRIFVTNVRVHFNPSKHLLNNPTPPASPPVPSLNACHSYPCAKLTIYNTNTTTACLMNLMPKDHKDTGDIHQG